MRRLSESKQRASFFRQAANPNPAGRSSLNACYVSSLEALCHFPDVTRLSCTRRLAARTTFLLLRQSSSTLDVTEVFTSQSYLNFALLDCSRIRLKMLDTLPSEVKNDILSRLPVDSLLRFRALSKSWCARIDGPHFAKAHLIKSIQTNSNLALIFADSNPNFLHKVSFPSLGTIQELDNPLNWPSYSDPTTAWIGLSAHEQLSLLGSCNGLVCFSNANQRLFLLNPSTRRFKALPLLSGPTKAKYDDYMYNYLTTGFGYEPKYDDYKVVRLSQYCNLTGSSFKTETMVYSLKVNAWRVVRGIPYALGIDFGGKACLAGQSLHWLVVRTQSLDAVHSIPNMIVAFDLLLEKYRALALPDAITESNVDYLKLKVAGEWLSVVSIYDPIRFDVWVMKEYGVVESWTKLISVPIDNLSSLKCLGKFVFSAGGDEILLEILTGNLVWYNLKKKCIKKVKMNRVVQPIAGDVFHESLVSLGVDEEKLVKNVNKKPNMKKEPEERKKTKKRDDFLSKGFKLVL